MNLYTFLAAGIDADRAAVCFDLPGTNSVTYGELADGAGRVAARLVADGVVPGDRVLLMAYKTIESVMAYLGVLKAGAVVVPVNTSYTESELKYFEEDAKPRLFVRDAAGFVDQCGKIEPLVRHVGRCLVFVGPSRGHCSAVAKYRNENGVDRSGQIALVGAAGIEPATPPV